MGKNPIFKRYGISFGSFKNYAIGSIILHWMNQTWLHKSCAQLLEVNKKLNCMSRQKTWTMSFFSFWKIIICDIIQSRILMEKFGFSPASIRRSLHLTNKISLYLNSIEISWKLVSFLFLFHRWPRCWNISPHRIMNNEKSTKDT